MNLSVKIGNLELKNPVMGASGTFGFGREYEDFLDVNEIGAIVTKGVTPKPRAGNPGVRIAETPSGMLNCIGLENRRSSADCFCSRRPGLVSAVKYRKEDGWRKHSIRGLWAGF